MPDTNPKERSERRRPQDEDAGTNAVEDAGTKAVEDVKDFFMAHGEDDSPTSDSGAQPPG
jgi:hypothetical protein